MRLGRFGPDPLPVDESESFASVRQVNQFKSELLLLQRPCQKKDVRAVVFNDKNPSCVTIRSVFQANRLPSSFHSCKCFR